MKTQRNEIADFIETLLSRPVEETDLSTVERSYLQSRLKLMKYQRLAAETVDQLDETLDVLRGQLDHAANLFVAMDQEIHTIDAVLAKPEKVN